MPSLLADRHALLVGLGGLGCPAAVALAAAGVRRFTFVDHDTVDPTNLGRQSLYGEADVGRRKVEAAADALRARFEGLVIHPVAGRFGSDAASLFAGVDVVLDGTDHFPTRFLLNDLCVSRGVPLVHGAALQWLGQVLAVIPGRTACLRCVFEGEPPGRAPTCAEAGVAAPLVGVVGAWMASRAVDVLRDPDAVPGGLRVVDGWTGRERFAAVERDPGCAACGRA